MANTCVVRHGGCIWCVEVVGVVVVVVCGCVVWCVFLFLACAMNKALHGLWLRNMQLGSRVGREKVAMLWYVQPCRRTMDQKQE